jgi:poly(beta-D-mannuronate) lyase
MQSFLKKKGYQYLLIFAGFLLVSCYSASAAEYYVTTPGEITSAMYVAKPGDTLTMANGVWTDAHIVFKGKGTEEQPILLRSETPGDVILSGSSNLRIAGDYLVVDGLYFKNGYSGSGGAIEFRNGTKNLSNHCRLTNTAIENCNPADANINDKWVSLYGSHNRVDHCYFKGKNNIGTTLVVWFERTSAPPAHYHLIDHNYFAHRPELGQNGGETIRIGTSTYSMSDSYTIVEHNYFEYCNGEGEIISNKSCENIYRYNTFYECQGALTLRHGNRCTVYGNFFIGNRKPNTGGVRVIGEDHAIYNNYFCGLYGSSFRSALPVLNGVPNSPLNRYFQVKNALIAFNTFVDCQYTLIIGAGADDERTLPPQDCIIANNLVKTSYQVIGQKAEPINMIWEGNIMQGSSLGIPQPEGITIIDPQLVLAEEGLCRPVEFSPAIGTATGDYDFVIDDMDGQPRNDGEKDIGCDEFSDVPIVNRPLTRNDVGPDWISSLDLPVTLIVTQKGSCSGSVMLNPAGGIYDVGTVVNLTALPERNCTFNGWSGDLTGTDNPVSIIMDSNKRVTATFAAPP